MTCKVHFGGEKIEKSYVFRVKKVAIAGPFPETNIIANCSGVSSSVELELGTTLGGTPFYFT